MEVLYTPRLELVPMSLPLVEAVLLDRRSEAARLVEAKLPEHWPGRALVERAFSVSLELIRKDPEHRLWGDRLIIARDRATNERRLVGSVVFHGGPEVHSEGVVEVGYGIEKGSQGHGYGSEATLAMVEWALKQPGVRAVTATTFPWHHASIKILQRAGLRRSGSREHDVLGELVEFERTHDDPPPAPYDVLEAAKRILRARA